MKLNLSIFRKLWKYILRNKIKSGIGLLVLILVFNFINSKNKKADIEFEILKPMSLSSVVNANGKIDLPENIKLSFEQGGKIQKIYVKPGDVVNAGDPLVALNDSVAYANYLQAKASFDIQKVRLDEIKNGTRPEELEIAQAQYDKASFELKQSLKDLADSASSVIVVSNTVVRQQLSSLIAYNWNLGKYEYKITYSACNSSAINDANFKRGQLDSILDSNNVLANKIINNQVELNDTIINQIFSDLNTIKNYLNILNDTFAINCNLSTSEMNILTQNQSIFNTAYSSFNTSYNAFNASYKAYIGQKSVAKNYEEQLNMKKSGATSFQVASQQAQVDMASANLELAKINLNKTVLTAPINGTVTNINPKVGELITATLPIVNIMSLSKIEVLSLIPESDIQGIKIGNKAKVRFDAFSNSDVFDAYVVSIDPGETIADNVVSYKVRLGFNDTDLRLKSGMTGEVDIITNTKENVLAIMQRYVIAKNGKRYVKVLEGKDVVEKEVTVGMRGENGLVEILSGIKSGDKILTTLSK